MKKNLTIILLILAAVLSAVGFMINNRTPGSGYTEGNGTWRFGRKYDLTKKEFPPEQKRNDLLSGPGQAEKCRRQGCSDFPER